MTPPNTPEEPAPKRLVLGRCTLELTPGELRDADGGLAGLRKQALEVLLVLGRRAGEVISKDELMSQVWPKLVVGEGSLTQAIAEIRRALGDDGHRLIRNVARRGYLLVPDKPPQVHLEASRVPVAVSAEPAAGPGSTLAPRRTRRHVHLGAALALAALLAVGLWMTWRSMSPVWQSPVDMARTPLPRDVPPLSIIVLPLTLLGDSKESEWLADALHGDLVIAVAQQQNILVIARDTASTYKGEAIDPRQVAREMGVRYVVHGSLRQQESRILLTLSLTDGESGVQRWAGAFDVDRAELAQAVGDFAVAVDRTLVAELYRSTAERFATLSPREVTADDLAMQGYALWYRGVTRENVFAARALFERALAMNRDSARAWAGISFTTVAVLSNSWTDDRPAALRRAEEAAANLERVDRDGTYAYSSKTFLLYVQGDFPGMLRITTEWSGRYRMPLAFGAHGGALLFNGRFDEAVSALERALRLGSRDPFRAEWQYRLALAHFGAGRYEMARDWSQTAAQTNSSLLWPPIHAAALLRLGQREAAQQAFDEHIRRHPGFVTAQAMRRIPGAEPDPGGLRSRLIGGLRELGMRER
jgi:TolB-like protein/DNA-binding winged helix-turn-helix (wHTH) protein